MTAQISRVSQKRKLKNLSTEASEQTVQQEIEQQQSFAIVYTMLHSSVRAH